jgi:hypothetical protein
MGPKSHFISALRSAVADERLRWWVYYVAAVMAGSVVNLIDDVVIGSHPEEYVASHPWAQPLDRCLFILLPVLAIVAIALWGVALWTVYRVWKTSRMEIAAQWIWGLVFLINCSPFRPARHWLRRLPRAAELAVTLDTVLLFLVLCLFMGIGVVAFKRTRVANRKEIEAYVARRASKASGVADHAIVETLAGGADRSGA